MPLYGGLTMSGIVDAFLAPQVANYHPLTLISHMLDVSLFGMWAGGHHLPPVLFHGINGVLLFLFFYRTTQQWQPSALVAVLFLVHPTGENFPFQ